MIVDCPKCELRHVILERAAGTVARCSCGTEITLPHGDGYLKALKCANCGGNPPAGANHCPYCDAHLATLRCARCYATSIEGDRHCRACGHELATPVRELQAAPAAVLDCPRCAAPLESVMLGDAVLDECTRCGGEWLSHGLFDSILRDRADREAILMALKKLRPAPRSSAPSPPNEDEPFYVKCPECSVMMDRRQFARISGVVVDVCAKHGMWFDKDELSAIIEFVGAGGLDRAADHLHEKRMAELKRRQWRRSQIGHVPRAAGGYVVAGDALAAVIGALIGTW